MKNRKKRPAFIFIAFALILALTFVFASCDRGSGKTETTEKPTDNIDSTQDATKDPDEPVLYKDNVPEMDLDGYKFRILSQRSDWLHAEMNFDEETSDIIPDAIYQRNRKIEERFNII